ncbi:MAG: oligosaccharide flippase family protein [Minisyncoccia bacterium]
MLAGAREKLVTLLRRTERYTKTDMVYLFSGWSWSLVGQFASSLCSFALAVVVGHFFPKDAYGDYKYIIAAVALISTFSLAGLGTAVFQSIASGFDGALYEGFWLNLRWSVLVFLGAFVVASYYFFLDNPMLAFGILIGGCLSPVLASANLSGAYLNAKKDFRRANLYFSVIETALATGALIATIFITKNPLALAAVYFAANTIATLFLYWHIVRRYRPDPQKTDPEMLSYGKHLSVISILAGLAGNLDQILLFHFVGPIKLAIYNFAIAIPDQTKGPLKALDKMIQAQFANRPDDEIRRGMASKTLILTIFCIAMVALYIAVAPFVYKIFFPNYTDSVMYSQIYALSYLTVIFTPAGSYLTAKKKVREQYMGSISMSILWIFALTIGVYFWGVLGLVVALTLTRFAGPALNYVLYVRSMNRSGAAY